MKPNSNFSSVAMLAILLISGCAKRSSVSSSGSDVRDDLSAVRPRYEYVEPVVKTAEPRNEAKAPAAVSSDKPLYVNKKLDEALDTMAGQNKSIRYINGFRIQIYVGNVRQEADVAKSYVYQAFPDLNPYVSYSQPTYRVKVGDFMYRSDAEQYLETIREKYASAMILPDKVDIKKSMAINPTADNN